MKITAKILCSLREIYATKEESEDNAAVVESLDMELEEVGALVDSLIGSVEKHIEERLAHGENESVLLSHKSYRSSRRSSVPSKIPSLEKNQTSKLPELVEQKQLQAKEEEERLREMEQEEKAKEQSRQKLSDELQLAKQRTDEARQAAKLNISRAEEAEQQLMQSECDTGKAFLLIPIRKMNHHQINLLDRGTLHQQQSWLQSS